MLKIANRSFQALTAGTHIRLFIAVIIALLRYRTTVRERHYLKRNALLYPYQAPWKKLWLAGDDCALICTTGFDRAAFNQIHVVFDTLCLGGPQLDARVC